MSLQQFLKYAKAIIDSIFSFVDRCIEYLRGDERPSIKETLGEWETVAEVPCDKTIEGMNGNTAKIGELTIYVEQNTSSGRMRAFYEEGVRIYLEDDEIADALRDAEENGFLV